jgi:uncharacterized protein (TIGR02466 family)
MKTNNYNIFPTPITVIEQFLTETQCNDIISYCKNLTMKEHDALTDEASSSFYSETKKLIQDLSNNVDSCKELELDLNNYLIDYSVLSGLQGIAIDNSWINVQTINSKLKKHSHPLSSISGALYLKVDNSSSKLYFYNPNPFIQFSKITGSTPYTSESVWFEPKVGDLILFPSWLMHGSDNDTNSTEDRTVLSFNTIL